MTTLTITEKPIVHPTANWRNDEVCRIGVEAVNASKDNDADADENEDNSITEHRIYSEWNHLPDLILEKIFSYLSVKERYQASLVCWQWYRAFYLPRVWDNFVINDRTLTRTRYNYYSGWQHCLDHTRTQQCLMRVGRYLRGLEFRPEHSFNNIFQFMTMMCWSIDNMKTARFSDLGPVGERIRSVIYIFPCNISQANDPEGLKLLGTGGQLLMALKDLLAKLPKLRNLQLIDFVLERYEAKHLLDEVLESSCMTMRVLNLVNVTVTSCPIFHVGLFLNLQILIISPQNIDNDVLLLLADSKLRHLHLLQNCYTPENIVADACSARVWRIVKRDNPGLRVHLRVESMTSAEFQFQPEAPVASVTYRAPNARIVPKVFIRMVDQYKDTLSVYGHELLPRFRSPKPFADRIDNLLMYISRECPNLRSLMIREKVSTSTILLIASTAKNLRKLYVRRFGVILRCEWTRQPCWTDDFHVWLRHCSRSYDAVEREVSQLLGCSWRFLTDREFKQIELNVRNEL